MIKNWKLGIYDKWVRIYNHDVKLISISFGGVHLWENSNYGNNLREIKNGKLIIIGVDSIE